MLDIQNWLMNYSGRMYGTEGTVISILIMVMGLCLVVVWFGMLKMEFPKTSSFIVSLIFLFSIGFPISTMVENEKTEEFLNGIEQKWEDSGVEVEEYGEYYSLIKRDGEEYVDIREFSWSDDKEISRELKIDKTFQGCHDDVYIKIDEKVYACE